MRKILLLAIFSLLVGCASMNESECVNADWRMIGLEDGMAGKSKSQIGGHRKACAKHSITPDLDAYNGGHAEGVTQFCTKARGFTFGHAGGTYSGVCPAHLVDDFMAGYRDGKELHSAEQAVRSLSSSIASYTRQIKATAKEIEQKETLLISDSTGADTRRTLLTDIKEAQVALKDLEHALYDAEHEIVNRQRELESLQRSVSY
jgi:hypothetical protein